MCFVVIPPRFSLNEKVVLAKRAKEKERRNKQEEEVGGWVGGPVGEAFRA